MPTSINQSGVVDRGGTDNLNISSMITDSEFEQLTDLYALLSSWT